MEQELSSVGVDAGEKAPETKDGKPSLVFWRSQLQAYDNISKAWKSDVDDAYDEYLHLNSAGGNTIYGRRKNADERRMNSHFPIFWSAVRTIQPALYSRTPVIVTEKAFKEMRDPVARLSAVILERIGKYLVRTSGFDRAMALAVTQFIMSEKTTVRVIFSSGISQDEVRNYYRESQVPVDPYAHNLQYRSAYLSDAGEEYEGDEPLEQDDEGRYFSTGIQENIEYLSCEAEVPHYKDFRHTPNARHWAEVDWMSFDSYLTRTEAEEMFGEEVAQQLTFSPIGIDKDKDRSKEAKGLPVYYVTVTEIWDKKRRKVYYYSPGYGEWLIHKNNPDGEDPYQLKDFFPVAPFML